jgi:hypothetical protein
MIRGKVKRNVVEQKDKSTMDYLRNKKANPLGWNDKRHCGMCGNSIPDNRYHGKCQDCYFSEHDVTLR